MNYFKGKNKEFSFRDLIYKVTYFYRYGWELLSISCRETVSLITSLTLTNPGSTGN